MSRFVNISSSQLFNSCREIGSGQNRHVWHWPHSSQLTGRHRTPRVRSDFFARPFVSITAAAPPSAAAGRGAGANRKRSESLRRMASSRISSTSAYDRPAVDWPFMPTTRSPGCTAPLASTAPVRPPAFDEVISGPIGVERQSYISSGSQMNLAR